GSGSGKRHRDSRGLDGGRARIRALPPSFIHRLYTRQDVTLQDFLDRAAQIERDGMATLQSATTLDDLEAARIAFLGDRQGQVKALQEDLRAISREEKPAAGKRFNQTRSRLESL